MTDRSEYGIYPAIGFARVGDLPLDLADRSSYNLGPERPGWRNWPPIGHDLKVRSPTTGVAQIKKQGCRFRVYRRRWVGETCQEDILDLDHPDVLRVTWRVLVRNCKPVGPRIFSTTGGLRNAGRQTDPAARAALILDPGVVHVEGRRSSATLGTTPMPAGFRSSPTAKPIASLGTLATDRKGNLIVFGGEGRAVSDAPGSPGPTGTFNNDDWFDDTCDGSIRAKVELRSGEVIRFSSIAPSWVVTAPPDYAPSLPNLVSLWDVLHDLGVRELGTAPDIYDRSSKRFRADWRPHFVDDVEPILIATARVRASAAGARSHVSKFAEYTAEGGHPAGSKTPAELFAKLRRPPGFEFLPGGSGTMPDLSEATLTPTQYWAMHQWSRGLCEPGSHQNMPRSHQATRAALEQAVGAAFHPGIEVTHSLADPAWFLSAPFECRIDPAKLAPGDVTKSMALPWHTDFLACGSNWWPTIRPGEVSRAGKLRAWDEGIDSNREMVDKWARLGWINESLVEVERDPI